MNINLLNLPAAICTIVFRKILDAQLGGRFASGRIVTRGPWHIEEYISPNVLYIYVIGAALTFLGNHLRRGTIFKIADSCTRRAITLRDKCLQKKRWLKRNRSWVLKNLLSSRENQVKALNYLSCSIPNPDLVQEHLPTTATTAAPCLTQPRDVGEISNATYFTASKDEDNPPSGEVIQSVDDMKIRTEKPRRRRRRKRRGKRQQSLDRGDCPSDEQKVQESGSCGSTMDVYTKSVIRELIPSDYSEESDTDTFQIPEIRMPVTAAAGTAVNTTSKKIRPITNRGYRREGKKHSNLSLVRKTRSGRIYGFREYALHS
ncbi:PREDICTED: uncharacterized protein LOC108564102 [Nicrophorus vespilloides]|uniref:Uncharacterized protein LOC108564102 n=1 Tax=Nicrophorus vespilloides TaxID=110193 RepID=A0ABM1MVB0_NICVS|nr:PREDICTED: uncharacterized protein LOC108564102 [Nicrophorus vespilloides]